MKVPYSNMKGNAIRNVGIPVKPTDALPWALPSFTEIERDELGASAGMIILNTTTNKLNFHNGTNWQIIT